MIITAFARATKIRSRTKLNRFGMWTSALKVVANQPTLRIRKLITDLEKITILYQFQTFLLKQYCNESPV